MTAARSYLKSTRAYSLDKRRFGLVKSAWDLAQALLTLQCMLLPKLWALSVQACSLAAAHAEPAAAWAENECLVSCVFVLGATILSSVAELPLQLYQTFTIEARHGFNKQSLATFALDFAKTVRALPSASHALLSSSGRRANLARHASEVSVCAPLCCMPSGSRRCRQF